MKQQTHHINGCYLDQDSTRRYPYHSNEIGMVHRRGREYSIQIEQASIKINHDYRRQVLSVSHLYKDTRFPGRLRDRAN